MLMSTTSLGDARPLPRPAAVAPPPSRTTPPARAFAAGGAAERTGNFAAIEEDEDGRTVIRGAPKVINRGPARASAAKMGIPASPTTISPAAVIKATLESARAGSKPKANHLMAGPPADLLEDLSDRHPADVGSQRTAILMSPPSNGQTPSGMVQGLQALSTQMLQPHAMPHGTMPPGSARPMSVPPPPMANPAQSGAYTALQSGGYPAHYSGPVPSGSLSVPGVVMPPHSMPAHFMVPQAPYSDARIDPPGTAGTSRQKSRGRPAASWAIALAAIGVFVGVGAVAVTSRNDGARLLETSAAFVDPTRANAKAAASPAAPGAAPPGAPLAAAEQLVVGVPSVVVPPAALAPSQTVTAPSTTTLAVAAAAPPATPAVGGAAAPQAAAAAPTTARPATAVAAAPAAAPARSVAAPVARPVRPVEEPVAATPAPAKGAGPAKPGAKGSGDSAVDEEQRKALKALQESQLQTPF